MNRIDFDVHIQRLVPRAVAVLERIAARTLPNGRSAGDQDRRQAAEALREHGLEQDKMEIPK